MGKKLTTLCHLKIAKILEYHQASSLCFHMLLILYWEISSTIVEIKTLKEVCPLRLVDAFLLRFSLGFLSTSFLTCSLFSLKKWNALTFPFYTVSFTMERLFCGMALSFRKWQDLKCLTVHWDINL